MATTTTKAPAPPALGTLCWNELLTGDTSKAETFYTKLFGWKAQRKDMGPMGTYTMFIAGDKEAAGLMKNPQPGAPSFWVPYVSVTNVDESARKAEQLGAKICVPPSDIPGVGRFSMITDPGGSTFGVFTASPQKR